MAHDRGRPSRILAATAQTVSYPLGMPAPIRLGTCSWADQGLIETWYPSTARSSEARLRYYAERYDTVEVNSSYYAIPEAGTATKWAERTPDGFVFHVKAFGMMTGHRVTPEQLPADLRPLVSQMTSRGHVDPSPALLERVFRRFKQALDPLASADRMGGVLMQYGPGLTPSDDSREFIEMGAELLAPYPVLVEFRQRDWLSEEHVESTLEFLRAHNLSHVIVDAPHVSTPNVAQTVIAATTDTAYVRYPRAQRGHLERHAAASRRTASTTSTRRRSCPAGWRRWPTWPAPSTTSTRCSTPTTPTRAPSTPTSCATSCAPRRCRSRSLRAGPG